MNARTVMLWVFRVGGAVMIANGTWMMLHAFNWFTTLPAGLADTGHANGHFIRDVGLCYVIFGVALLWCCKNLMERRAVFLMCAAFMAGHALGHVIEILTGALPHSHWLIDLPVVLLPGALFAAFVPNASWRWLSANA